MENHILYIAAKPHKLNSYLLDVESVISVFIFQLIKKTDVELRIKIDTEQNFEPLLIYNLSDTKYNICNEPSELTRYCKWPVVVSDRQVVAGLCAVARFLLKQSDSKEIRDLLGFREACLLSCAESSIWTRFCEVDIISMTKDVLRNKYRDGEKYYLPEAVLRFEYHMSKPVRMHNLYKEAREKNNDKGIKSNTPIDKLNLEHKYSEGTYMTLADVILYPCFTLFFWNCCTDLLQNFIPLTTDWFKNLKEKLNVVPDLDLPKHDFTISNLVEPEYVKQSLYTADPARYRPEKRIHTKQQSIDRAVNFLGPIESYISNKITPFGDDIEFDWLRIPIDANPNGGALPAKRASRKCEQLQNIVKAVMKLAIGKLYNIVDFCSGSGHVGILLAVLLPNSKIFLVENKEKSLSRARERIIKLNLNNVNIIQSNLDYFVGHFDIGVALHACGLATDLVMETCIRNNAHFILCPCCYGGVKNCHHLTYPRSTQFKNTELGYEGYLSIAHAADQTHDEDNAKTKQGYFCMDVIDTDRKLYAESCKYVVHLGKLHPSTCTNKNNLLVGIFKEKIDNVFLL